MLDREEVISNLAEVYALMRSYATDAGKGSAVCEAYRKNADIVADAFVLLKADRAYLQNLTERLQYTADIASRGLPEDWMPTENEPCKSCSNNPKNGGSGICLCTLGMPQVTC